MENSQILKKLFSGCIAEKLPTIFDLLKKYQNEGIVMVYFPDNGWFERLSQSRYENLGYSMRCIIKILKDCSLNHIPQKINECMKSNDVQIQQNIACISHILAKLCESQNEQFFNYIKNYNGCTDICECKNGCELKMGEDLCAFCKTFEEYHLLKQRIALNHFLVTIVPALRRMWNHDDNNDWFTILDKCKQVYEDSLKQN